MYKKKREEKAQKVFIIVENSENTQKLEDICRSKNTDANFVLSITHSASLAGFSKRFMKQLEENRGIKATHQGPITSTYLKTLNEVRESIANMNIY